MKYLVENNKITILGLEDFNIEHILLCGQCFRFKKVEQDYIVYSTNKKCIVREFGNKDYAEILTNDTDYFINYFDLNTDYSKIKESLKNFNIPFLNKAIETYYGIRILNQEIYETFFSFMISSNNNIKRIQKIIESLSVKMGAKVDDYYAFPTISELKRFGYEDFLSAGLGYRSNYFVKTLKVLDDKKLYQIENLDYDLIKKELLSFNGVGNKVADCILLFGYHKYESFPCDVWIEKMYNENFKKETDRVKISQNLVKIFGKLSGYAQQYLFHYIRNFKN